MKTSRTKCEFLQQRNENLRREFNARLGTGLPTIDAIFDSLACARAERYYISEERAYRLIRHRQRLRAKAGRAANQHKDTDVKTKAYTNGADTGLPAEPPMRAMREAMIESIEREVERLMATDASLSFKEAIFRVVNSPAPHFFLTLPTLKRLLYRG